jgi:predicted outer membrane repeat protein
MAINMAQDVDEIRVEQGTYQCDGLEIPSSKKWTQEIRISGGWDSTFENQNPDAALTVFDGGVKRIDGIEDKTECEQAGGYWEAYSFCFQEQPSEKRILIVNAGPVAIEGLSFQNGYSGSGGTIGGRVNINNSIFTNNSADNNGGAVSGSRNIINSTFMNNSADGNGGAVSGSGNIINSIFTNNSATSGGAIYSYSYSSRALINSTLINNNASESGGAFYSEGTILNSIFIQNQAAGEANDISPTGELHVDYTLANYISGAVDLGTHFIMGDPRFVDPENGNFHLLPDSPAINIGDPNVIDDYDFPTNDQGQAIDLEGKPRIIHEGIDLGAYEFQ